MFTPRIGTRVVGGFLLVVGLMIVVGIVALSGLRDVRRHYQDALGSYYGRAVAGLELETALLEQVRAQKNYLLREEPQYLGQVSNQRERVRAARAKLGEGQPTPEEAALLRRVDRAMEALNDAFQSSIAARRAAGIEAADRVVRGKAAAVTALLDELIARAQRRALDERARALDRVRWTAALVVVLTIALGFIALGLGLALSLSVTRPLGRLQAQIDAVAQGGSPPPEPAVSGSDEVARMARTFHELVRNAAVLREMEARSKRLEALSARVARAQEQERERIARELHDGLGQALTAIKLDLAAAARTVQPDAAVTREHLAKAQRIADESIDELRRLAFDLRPAALDNLGLVAALESYARGFKERGIAITLEADEFEPRLTFDVETALYRIYQEALTNVTKHAQARHAAVRLRREVDRVILTITDDGVGFDTSSVSQADGALKGIGLLSMERRAEELGGRFEIESAPGQGTTVTVTVPLNTPGQS